MRREKHYEINDDTLTFFFDIMSIFNRHSYFTKELWRKVKGFKNEDRAEVHCAFMSAWVNGAMGIHTYPVGCGWCDFKGDKDLYEDYIAKYQPLFDDYGKWCDMQR